MRFGAGCSVEAFEVAEEIVLEVFVEAGDDGTNLFQLLPVEVIEYRAVMKGDLCVADLPAKVGEKFDFGLGGGHIADLFGGSSEYFSQRFFCEVEVRFGKFGETFVHFLFDGGDKGVFIGGFEEEIGKEFLVVFFKFGEPEAEFGEVGGGEVFELGLDLLDG
jgi:hypothetical protein